MYLYMRACVRACECVDISLGRVSFACPFRPEEPAGGAQGIRQDKPTVTAWEDPFCAEEPGEPPGRYANEEEDENGG